MKLILVALDNSPRAPKVLEAALSLAKITGAKLHLLRAVGLPPEVPIIPLGITPDGFMQVLIDDAKVHIDAVAKNVPPELLAGAATHVGTPWSAICETAKEIQADLIVIGSHGYSGLDRVMGTTAAKVVNHAECSVLVARNLHV